jgi:hypothetical protein
LPQNWSFRPSPGMKNSTGVGSAAVPDQEAE